MADDIKQGLGVWQQIQPIYRKSYKFKLEEMKEKIESDVKIGDLVELMSTGCHNSNAKGCIVNIAFQLFEIGNYIEILDIIKVHDDELAYKVKCEKGITYLRRSGFKPVSTAPHPKEDLSYLIPLLESNNIT